MKRISRQTIIHFESLKSRNTERNFIFSLNASMERIQIMSFKCAICYILCGIQPTQKVAYFVVCTCELEKYTHSFLKALTSDIELRSLVETILAHAPKKFCKQGTFASLFRYTTNPFYVVFIYYFILRILAV